MEARLDLAARPRHRRAALELIGQVVENEPAAPADASQQDDSDALSRVIFDIKPQGDIVRLMVTHDDL